MLTRLGILFAFNGNKFPGYTIPPGENLFNVVKGVLKTSSSDEVIVFYACTILL